MDISAGYFFQNHSNNGKVSAHLSILTRLYNADFHQVDFTEVAKECNIVSKGAA